MGFANSYIDMVLTILHRAMSRLRAAMHHRLVPAAAPAPPCCYTCRTFATRYGPTGIMDAFRGGADHVKARGTRPCLFAGRCCSCNGDRSTGQAGAARGKNSGSAVATSGAGERAVPDVFPAGDLAPARRRRGGPHQPSRRVHHVRRPALRPAGFDD